MLTKGLKVQIREDGQRQCVENLQISDLIYNPLTRKHVEITDILSREVSVRSKSDPLFPSVISAGSLGRNRPTRDILVSPAQSLLYGQRQSPNSPPVIVRKMASDFVTWCDFGPDAGLEKVHYYAIFTEGRQLMNVADVLLETYESNIFIEADEHEAEKLKNRSKIGAGVSAKIINLHAGVN